MQDKSKRYWNVAEMSEMVNALYDLLGQAKGLARELITANVRNEFELRFAPDSDEVKKDIRPYGLDWRIQEAKKYQRVFEDLRAMLTRAEAHIAKNY